MTFPTLVSDTPLGNGSTTGWTPLSAVDLSNCTLAIVCVGTISGTDAGTISINAGASTSGWLALAATLTSDSGVAASRVFYKFNPTSSETLVLTNSTGGARAWEARLLRISGAGNILGSGFATNDPPSVDALAVNDLLVIAWGLARAIQPYTAGPAGYSGFDWDSIGGGIPGEGFAYKAVATQVENPGTFTTIAVNRRQAWTIALWSSTAAAPVGLATETEAALGLGAGAQAGIALESDLALALGSAQILGTGLAAETETGFALTRLQIGATGRADSTESALALAGIAELQAGVAVEIDTALLLAGTSIRAIGLANETNIAVALGMAAPAAAANENDIALALGAAVPAGLAAEAALAFALRGRVLMAVPAERAVTGALDDRQATDLLAPRISAGATTADRAITGSPQPSRGIVTAVTRRTASG